MPPRISLISLMRESLSFICCTCAVERAQEREIGGTAPSPDLLPTGLTLTHCSRSTQLTSPFPVQPGMPSPFLPDPCPLPEKFSSILSAMVTSFAGSTFCSLPRMSKASCTFLSFLSSSLYYICFPIRYIQRVWTVYFSVLLTLVQGLAHQINLFILPLFTEHLLCPRPCAR
jgi:hypothetical protein